MISNIRELFHTHYIRKSSYTVNIATLQQILTIICYHTIVPIESNFEYHRNSCLDGEYGMTDIKQRKYPHKRPYDNG